ncbi:hypothetical protein K445DRAFT_381710 [Daldinia sp. EC12]|nr:hypothetical protein K445DRAFT_381710 [Daldinia sp. EC12]
MGAKASKPAKSAIRKFPARAPGSAAPPHARPQPAAQRARDSVDPDPNPFTNAAFSQRLKQMGVATPNPTLSNSSTAAPYPGAPDQGPHSHLYPSPAQNQTLSALEARQRLQERATVEFENVRQGREFLDVGTLKQALVLQARGTPPAEIERRLRLKSGVVDRLGPKGVTLPLT